MPLVPDGASTVGAFVVPMVGHCQQLCRRSLHLGISISAAPLLPDSSCPVRVLVGHQSSSTTYVPKQNTTPAYLTPSRHCCIRDYTTVNTPLPAQSPIPSQISRSRSKKSTARELCPTLVPRPSSCRPEAAPESTTSPREEVSHTVSTRLPAVRLLTSHQVERSSVATLPH
jgi:hypothetical protein